MDGKKNTRTLLVLSVAGLTGVEQHVLSLAVALGGFGWKPYILFLEDGPSVAKANDLGLPNKVIPVRSAFDPAGWEAVSRWVSDKGFALTHCHGARALLATAPAAARQGPVGVTFHEFVSSKGRSGPMNKLQAWIETWLTKRYTSFQIAVSDAVKEDLIVIRKLPPEGIVRIYNGHDQRWVLTRGDETICDPDWDAPEGTINVVSLGRTARLKGVYDWMEAAGRVVHRRTNVRFWWIGGPDAEAMNRAARARGGGERVRFLGAKNNPLPYLKRADIFALPSWREPFGLVLLEAMILGKPIVASRSGGPLEIMTDGVDGLLVAPRDPGAMAEAIERLIDSPELRRKLSSGAESRGKQFTSDACARGVSDVYNKALGYPSTNQAT